MAAIYRNLIASNIRHVLKSTQRTTIVPETHQFVSKMTLQKPIDGHFIFRVQLPVNDEKKDDDDDDDDRQQPQRSDDYYSVMILDNKDRLIQDPISLVTTDTDNGIRFGIPTSSDFCQRVIRDVITGPEIRSDWAQSDPEFYPAKDRIPRKIVVEFSSPNIAKPFHVGHLRSTITGNFVANVYRAVGHQVVRINWLGDWGTQFGLLAVGIQDENYDIRRDVMLTSNPLKRLNEIYVRANARAEVDEKFRQSALDAFRKLEDGDPFLRRQWDEIRECSIRELKRMYERLGIRFDHFHGESMYDKEYCERVVLRRLRRKNLLLKMSDEIGKSTFVRFEENLVPLTKSDGSTLYLTRDLAAALDRAERFQFDEMFYVVENGQSQHFKTLFSVLLQLDSSSSSPFSRCHHVKFGRIHGMSSRKGTAVLLSDILDEARDRCLERQDISRNTRLESAEEKNRVADIGGITGVLVNDMKNKRMRNYAFEWNKVFRKRGDTFQYTHCRLHRLLSEQSVIPLQERHISFRKFDCNYVEHEAHDLVYHIALFDEKLRDSYLHLEPYILVRYLQDLCDSTSKAFRSLSVKNADNEEQAGNRILLFSAAKRTLLRGLDVLGIQPLEKM